METAIIIAIISSSLTAIVTIINVLFSVFLRKRSDRLAIITSGRVKYLDKIRVSHTEFMGRTTSAVAQYCAKAGDKQNYPVELTVAAEGLKTFFKPFYKIEQKIIAKIDSLVQACLQQFKSPETDISLEIKNLRNSYYKLYSQYDWSYWKYIQAQYSGKHMDSDKDFDLIYEQTKKELESPDYKWE